MKSLFLLETAWNRFMVSLQIVSTVALFIILTSVDVFMLNRY